MRLLMYADDIVLLAESAQDLQNMLDVVTAYSRRWRFRLNPKKGKSEVMIFGRKPRNKTREWWLLGKRSARQRCTSIEKWTEFQILQRKDSDRSEETHDVGVGNGNERGNVRSRGLC